MQFVGRKMTFDVDAPLKTKKLTSSFNHLPRASELVIEDQTPVASVAVMLSPGYGLTRSPSVGVPGLPRRHA